MQSVCSFTLCFRLRSTFLKFRQGDVFKILVTLTLGNEPRIQFLLTKMKYFELLIDQDSGV